MDSRSPKEIPTPLETLTVAQRCKPMRVAKTPRKPRTHKVKQGAPPKLSASQKRKLVRLYLYTNLSWKSISTLVLHFGSKNVEKRALQYVLQGFLGSQYNQMRPRDVDSRRKRRSQIQKLKEMKSIQGSQHTTTEAQTQPTKTNWHRPTDEDLDHVGYPNDFDFLIGDIDHEYQKANPLSQGLEAPSSSVITSDPTCSPLGPPLKALSAADLLDDTNIHTGDFSSAAHTESLDSYIPILDDPPFGTHFEEYSVEHDLPEFIHLSNVSPRPGSTVLAAESSPKMSTSIVSSTKNRTGSSRPRTLHQRDTDSVIDGLNLRGSNLSGLINRLSRCSEDERRFINDLLKRCSVSTLSSITNSINSNPSLSFTQETKRSDTRTQSLTQKTKRSDARKRSQLLRLPPLDLPGDFITSKINTFSHHVACNMEHINAPRSSGSRFKYYCSGCCMDRLSRDDVRLCIPLAVTDFKWGVPAQRIWSEGGENWVDRFGNTALHIAAALGAQYDQLQSIMQAGVSVHEVNSAGQTFMHLLSPRSMRWTDMFSLSDDLEQQRFDFSQLDVLGQTFLDHFASCGIRPLDLHYVALLYNCSSKAEGQESNGRQQGGMRRGLQTIAPLLLRASAVNSLRSYKDYRDRLGNSCLHIAIIEGHTYSDSFHMKEHVKLVEDLLGAGHSPDHRDVFGATPLMYALLHAVEGPCYRTLCREKMCYDHIIEELLNYGANVNARNHFGETPLHLSVALGIISATQILLRRGANVHARESEGRGVLAVGRRAQHDAIKLTDEGGHARITACIALAVDAGAIASPNPFQEWDMWKPKSPYQLSKEGAIMTYH
ncbi:MAG: hypothetical protein Q9200_001261 [Gallowayella weberi]